MARVLNVAVSENKVASDSEGRFSAIITVANPPEGVNPLDVTVSDLAFGLKVLGVYRTPIQCNQQMLIAVRDYLDSVYSIPTNSYDAEFLSGAMATL